MTDQRSLSGHAAILAIIDKHRTNAIARRESTDKPALGQGD